MKYSICCLVTWCYLLFSTSSVEAQTKIQVGPYLGNGIRLLNGNDEIDIGFGYHAGILVRVPVNEMVSVAPNITFARKGYNELGFLILENDEYFKQRLNYLDVVIPLKFQIAETFTFQVGVQTGFLLDGELAYKFPNYSKESADITDDLNKVDWGIMFGAGFQFMNGIGIDFTVNPGFSNIYEDDPPLYYNPDDQEFVGDEFNGKNFLATINLYYLFGYEKKTPKKPAE